MAPTGCSRFPLTLERSKKGSCKFARNSSSLSELIICFGEMLIDFIATSAGVSLADSDGFKKAVGGAPANVAVGISRLGGFAAFMGKVGKDEFGYILADILKENNVDNSGMRLDPHARSALAFVTLRSDGECKFMFYRTPSADMLLHEKELGRLLEKGVTSIWNQADIIKISEDEIEFLTGGDDPYDDGVVLKKLYHPNLKLLLVTEGSAGCRYYTKEFKGKVAGIKADAVDTTGAGDSFVAAILNSLGSEINLYKDERKLREALLFANGCGALTVQKKGAIPALPTKEAVNQLLQQTTA
ncbi:fructokinase-4 [Pyrus ussuriensis x Pyrus communis]|uniref:Fructokinase-4 n=1 Tax=Pyrus ussuriensis x Pyrus communis TaxID=2448454 RepID=A0A5N5EX74_9ROSA|nr:fructokinase-4 [Pyrus ussuriensis x Pyrus communis]